MKASPFIVVLVLTNTLFLAAEDETAQAGYLQVVNLVTLPEPTRIHLGGFPFNEGQPVTPGEGSGLLAILPGEHPFTFENAAAKPREVSFPLTIEHGKTVFVICYDETRVYRDGSRERKLRHQVLVDSEDHEGPRLSLVSLLNEPLLGIEVSGDAVTLKAKTTHHTAVKLDDEIRLSHKGRTLLRFEITQAVLHIGFFYANPKSGEIEVTLIQSANLEYQAPLKPEKGKPEPLNDRSPR